jgi:hypothetical protein
MAACWRQENHAPTSGNDSHSLALDLACPLPRLTYGVWRDRTVFSSLAEAARGVNLGPPLDSVALEGCGGVMNNDAQCSVVVTQIAKGFVHLALGSISGFKMHPANGIGGISEALDDKNLGYTFHLGAAIVAGGANAEPGIIEGRVSSHEIGQGATARLTKRCVAVCPGWLEGHRTKLIAVGRVDDLPC